MSTLNFQVPKISARDQQDEKEHPHLQGGFCEE